MVLLFGYRRHRLNPDETLMVRGLVYEKLWSLYEQRTDILRAEELYRIIHRIDRYGPGRPEYPENFSWAYLGEYLRINGPLMEVAESG